MATYERNYLVWKDVKRGPTQHAKICLRCRNNVNYKLVYDGAFFGLSESWSIPIGKQLFAYKCPICPEHELVPREIAKQIMRGH